MAEDQNKDLARWHADDQERPPYEDATESKAFIEAHAREMCKHILKVKGTKELEIDGKTRSVLDINVLSVLGPGWPAFWKEVLENQKFNGFSVQANVLSYDNNPRQIKLHGGETDNKVTYISIGQEEGNAKLANVLGTSEDESRIDVFFMSNIGDFIGNMGSEVFLEVIEETRPPVIVFGGQEYFTELAQLQEGLEDLDQDGSEDDYKVIVQETGDKRKREVSFQAVAYYDDSEEN